MRSMATGTHACMQHNNKSLSDYFRSTSIRYFLPATTFSLHQQPVEDFQADGVDPDVGSEQYDSDTVVVDQARRWHVFIHHPVLKKKKKEKGDIYVHIHIQ